MKKVLISVGVVVIFAAYAVYQHLHGSSAISPTTVVAPTQTNQTPVSQNPPASTTTDPNTTGQPATTPPTPATPPVSQGQYKDGTYNGSVADAFYGQMQVQAIVSGGKITDVQFLQFPNDRGETQQVSARALPVLKSEAIAAQSANVNAVSGATQDSQAFQQSLQSALDQAKS